MEYLENQKTQCDGHKGERCTCGQGDPLPILEVIETTDELKDFQKGDDMVILILSEVFLELSGPLNHSIYMSSSHLAKTGRVIRNTTPQIR